MNDLRKVVIVGGKDHVNQVMALSYYFDKNILGHRKNADQIEEFCQEWDPDAETPDDDSIIVADLAPSAHAIIAEVQPEVVAVIIDRKQNQRAGEFLTLLSADPRTSRIPLKLYRAELLLILDCDPELAEVGSHMILEDPSRDAAATIVRVHNSRARDRTVN